MSLRGVHERPIRGATDEWLTPPWLFGALGEIDLDPCAPIGRPWEIARVAYTVDDDGLSLPWLGFVFCNPPYGTETWRWMRKMNQHNNGISLVAARTETKWFQAEAWNASGGLFFLAGRVRHCRIDGSVGTAASFGSCLVAHGAEASRRLDGLTFPGVRVRPECVS